MFGSGCLVQLLGLIVGGALFLMLPLIGWILGPLIVLALLIVGSKMATVYECGNCRNPLPSRHVRLCPICGASFK